MQRCYLDNAATSWPKPEGVLAAMDRYHRELGVAAGRGATRAASEVDATISRSRQRAARLFNAESSDRILFTFNGTDSLNVAIHGCLQPGDHVVASSLEHNSVLRPLSELRERIGIETTFIEPEANGRVEPTKFRAALRPNTKLVALLHASNVTGVVQPIDDVGAIARQAGALMLVDAAQTAGHLPIDVRNSPIDLLACPGHKGLLGPLGTGLLYLRLGIEQHVTSFRQGGTGSLSEDDRQPERLPDKYESGNHNAPGLFGLEAALDWLEQHSLAELRLHELSLRRRLIDSLADLKSVRLFAADLPDEFVVGVLSFAIVGFDPQEMAAILDHDFQIQIRAGLHCAPGTHRSLGTLATGGTIRVSFGPTTTVDEVERLVAALRNF
ncbi:MAG: aminotransferase class V-fold PLP-dependent enzyme [Planctomycetaceae bacterium]